MSMTPSHELEEARLESRTIFAPASTCLAAAAKSTSEARHVPVGIVVFNSENRDSIERNDMIYLQYLQRRGSLGRLETLAGLGRSGHRHPIVSARQCSAVPLASASEQ
jgi:hypothetical protein